jgi:hypothetical protein
MPKRPGTRNRFSRLIRQYKESGGASTNPAVIEFGNFLKGINKPDVNRKPTGDLIKRYRAKVVPFGVTPKATLAESYFAVTITGQAYSIYNGLGAANNPFGLQLINSPAEGEGVKNVRSYFPAIARLFVAAASALPTPTTSGITKQSYKSTKGRSGSIPFGRGITGVTDAESGQAETTINEADEGDVSYSIAAAVKGAFPTFVVKSVTFVPEAFVPPSLSGFAPETPPALNL